VIEVKKSFAANDTTLENTFTDNISIENISIKENETLPPNAIEAFCTTNFPAESLFYSVEDKDKVTAFRNFLKVYFNMTLLFC
jgi:hypothetical protein